MFVLLFLAFFLVLVNIGSVCSSDLADPPIAEILVKVLGIPVPPLAADRVHVLGHADAFCG